MNAIQDNPITESDIKQMECLYGPDIPTIKGKTTRGCPHKLVSDMVLIPHELCDTQCNVCLYIDIMYVNGMPFLTTISKNIKYRTAMWVADCMAPTITSLVESVLKLYNRAGFQVTEVCTNCKFKPVLHVLQDSGWSFMTNLANAQELFLKLSTIIASSRSVFMPLIMGFLKKCPTNCYLLHGNGDCSKVKLLSCCLNYYSPREILHHVKLDYVPCLSSVTFLPMMNLPLPTLFMHMHWIVFFYTQCTWSKVDMNVTISPLANATVIPATLL